MHVLLIGTSRLLLKALTQALEDEGVAVTSAWDAGEAETRVRTAAYDVLVVDLAPPEEAGLELLRRWRAASLPTPVLALTAADGPDGRTRTVPEVSTWLTKPFGLDEFLDRVRAVADGGAGPIPIRAFDYAHT